MKLGSAKTRARQRKSIGEEWVGWLPPGKAEAFAHAKFALDADSWMLRVALNEGVGLTRQGCPAPALELASICADLFARLSARIEAALRTLDRSSQNLGILPNCAPLNAEFFRSEQAMRRAKRSRLFSYLMTHNSRFSLKLEDLVLVVSNLAGEFHPLAAQISRGFPPDPQNSWNRLEILEYDLSTCLGETLVILKSFLHVLPNHQVGFFQDQIGAAVRTSARLVAPALPICGSPDDADSVDADLPRRRWSRDSSS